MFDNIYIYAHISQNGDGPICMAGDIDIRVPAQPPPEQPPLDSHDANAISAQALHLTELLLRSVPKIHRENMGLFMGTRFGSLEDDRIFQQSRRDEGGRFVSPAAFRRTLPSTIPAEISIAFGLHGPLITFADSAAPARLAITRAARWIASGKISSAIAGSFDFLTATGGNSPNQVRTCHTRLCLAATRETLADINPLMTVTQAIINDFSFLM